MLFLVSRFWARSDGLLGHGTFGQIGRWLYRWCSDHGVWSGREERESGWVLIVWIQSVDLGEDISEHVQEDIGESMQESSPQELDFCLSFHWCFSVCCQERIQSLQEGKFW